MRKSVCGVKKKGAMAVRRGYIYMLFELQLAGRSEAKTSTHSTQKRQQTLGL